MLQYENIDPNKIAYDRPSPKLLGFLRKHYDLKDYIPQNNNFVIYRDFFERGYKIPQKAFVKYESQDSQTIGQENNKTGDVKKLEQNELAEQSKARRTNYGGEQVKDHTRNPKGGELGFGLKYPEGRFSPRNSQNQLKMASPNSQAFTQNFQAKLGPSYPSQRSTLPEFNQKLNQTGFSFKPEVANRNQGIHKFDLPSKKILEDDFCPKTEKFVPNSKFSSDQLEVKSRLSEYSMPQSASTRNTELNQIK